ncbi:MAG: hypothetical protein NC393_08220 [Clostridium sp.]|nr:hypothetical protein [Clostridium sp.]
MIKGICRYCNQVILLDESDITDLESEDAITEAAAMKCQCDGAKYYQWIAKREEKTKDNIELAFHENSEEIEQIMKAAVKPMLEDKITKITIDSGKGYKGTMNVNSKGAIKVKISATKEAEFVE